MSKYRQKVAIAPEPREIHRQKLETIGALAGGIAHDFNNILTGILGHISFIKLALEQESETRESIDAIEHGARRAATLAQQIVQFAKGEETKMSEVNLVNVVTSCIGLLSAALPKNVDISLASTSEELCVFGNESQISQIVMNLTVNAVEAMPRGGNLDVLLRKQTMTRKMFDEKGLQLSPGVFATLSVQDSGVGMSESQKKNIFKPFFTTKGHGTGLGLATVLWITESHNGGICVHSGSGKGTKFEVFLPVADQLGELAEKEQEAPEGTIRSLEGNERVLLIDDEESVRTVVARSLEHLGYRVTSAKDGKEGLDIYLKDPSRYDIVVVDMIMPEMAGDEFFKHAKKANKGIKVILCSGYAGTERTTEMLEAGAKTFLQKPFIIEDLVEQIRAVLDESSKSA